MLGIMRARVRIIVFIAVFILCNPAFGLPSEFLQVHTQSAGLLLLPPEWRVVSKDEAPERGFIMDSVLNVQQVLYARSEHVSADAGAVLQIFSIWGTDREGNEKTLPKDILESDSFVSALIGTRYGNVGALGTHVVETALENLSVATYEVEFSPTDGSTTEFRYKCVSLYRGEKRVLVLLKYEPAFEDYWHGRLENLLNTWVGSLTLTPRPAPVIAPRLETPLPLLPEPPEQALLPVLPETAPPEQPEQPKESPAERPSLDQSAPAPVVRSVGRSIPGVWLFSLAAFFCAFFALAIHRLEKKETPVPPKTVPAVSENNAASPPDVRVPTPDEERPSGEPVCARFVEAPVYAKQNLCETTSNALSSATEKRGFDKVYSLLDQALNFIETGDSVYETKASYVDAVAPVAREDRVAGTVFPNMADTKNVMDELKKAFGDVFALDELEDKIFKTLELNAYRPKILPAKDVAPDCLVLALCRDTLFNMLGTGRYHICKGILSSEGEALAELLDRINDLRAQKTYITPEEAEQDAEFIKYCTRESGYEKPTYLRAQ